MLYTVKFKVVIDQSRQLHLQLPPDTPSGEAEVIVMVTPAQTQAANAAPMAELGAGTALRSGPATSA